MNLIIELVNQAGWPILLFASSATLFIYTDILSLRRDYPATFGDKYK